MKNTFLAILLLIGLSGCRSTERTEPSASSADFKPSKHESAEITPANDAFQQRRTQARKQVEKSSSNVVTEGDLFELPKFVINEQAFARYGFSIVTNAEVLHGGRARWVQLGVVLPDSIAARHNLESGMKILAVDDVMITDMSREQLIRALFERDPADRPRLLMLSRKLGLRPLFVTLGSNVPLPR